jgi:hypothetical protein
MSPIWKGYGSACAAWRGIHANELTALVEVEEIEAG